MECFRANFKPLRGDYAADQALYTVEATSYEPNDYNLYNMAGNVAEWVDSSYDPASYDFSSNMNPNVNDTDNYRKVVRGGSWKDIAYFLQVSSRDYEYQDSARSYIGFRTVQDYMGTDVILNEKFGDAPRPYAILNNFFVCLDCAIIVVFINLISLVCLLY